MRARRRDVGCEYDRSVNDIHITPAKSIILLVTAPDATPDAGRGSSKFDY